MGGVAGRFGHAGACEMPGAYHALLFHKADGSGDVVIDTTRPELLAA